MPTSVLSGLATLTSFASSLTQVIPNIQNLASQLQPFFYCISFVLLVFGSMRGFLHSDTQRFLGNLLRVVILIALMGSWPAVKGAASSAVNAFCTAQVNSNLFSQTNTNMTGLGLQTNSGTGQLNVSALENVIMQKGLAQINPSLQQTIINFFTPVTHYLCMILYAIYLLALVVCQLIVAGMNLLQQCVLMLFDLYVPIGLAEFSVPNLRGQAETFFKAYLGVQCWPIGWILANVVTVALFNCLAPPAAENAIAIVIAIVVCIPIVLWMVIGYVLAPFYVQKVVMRGGAELQAFAGAMISAVGGTSGTFYGGAFGMAKRATVGLSQGMGAIKYPVNNGGSGMQQNNNAGNQANNFDGQQGSGIDDALGSFLPGYRHIEEPGGSNRGAADGARNLGLWGLTKAVDAGEFAARTAGNMADTLGTLVADASGNRVGPERNFSLPRMQRNSSNRSSRRAASYLNQSTPNQSNPSPSDLNNEFPND
jgi:hypothetical protein